MKPKKILIVEDDKMLMTVYRMFISELGYEVLDTVREGEQAIEACKKEKPSLVIMDIHLLGEMDGIKAAKIIQEKQDVPVIFLTSDTEEATIKRAIKTNSYGYLLKPVDKTMLGINIELALYKHKIDREIRIREGRYRTLIEDSPEAVIVITNGIIEFVNFSGLKLLGTIHIEEIIDQPISSIITEDSIEIFNQATNNALLTNNRINLFECNLKSICNKIISVGIIGSVIDFKNQKSLQLVIREKCEASPIASQINETGYYSNFKALLNSTKEVVFLIDTDYNIIDFNQLAKQFTQNMIEKDLYIGVSVFDFMPFISKVDAIDLLSNASNGISHYLERSIKTEEDARIYQISISPILDSNSKVINYLLTYFDITNTRMIERELNETKAELKPLFDSSIQRFYLADMNYKIVAFNKAARDTIKAEFSHELRKGDNLIDFAPSEVGKRPFQELFNRAQKGEHVIFKEKLVLDVNENWVEVHLEPIINEKGEIYRILLWTLDITKEKESEIALLESRKKYYSLFSEANDAILLIDDDNKFIIDCNNKAIELFGYKKEELLHLDLLSLSPLLQPSGSLSEEKRDRKINDAKNGVNTTFYWVYKRKNGDSFDSEVSLSVVKIDKKEYLHAIIRDISRRKEIERSLRESELRNKSLLKAIPDIIFVLDKDGRYLDYKIDRAHAMASDPSEIIGKTLTDFFKGEDLELFQNKISLALSTTELQNIEYEMTHTVIGKRKFEARISPINETEVLILVRDLTDYNT